MTTGKTIALTRWTLCWLYRTSPSLAAKNIINLISVLTIWWCPYVESSLVLLEEGVCYDQCSLLAKLSLVKAMVFPVVMYGCESWIIKKAEQWRTDIFELWCWRKLLRVPWTARRSNQSILKEISLEYSLEGLILKLKLQYFGHLMRRTDSLEKSLMLGKIEGRRRRGRQRMR